MTNGELDELLVRHEPALRRLAASYERDPALREDLVQEMLLALFRALPAWRRECSERTFVYRVANNRALSHLASRRPPFDDLDRAAGVPDPAPLPEAIAVAGQQHETLLAALRRLPVPQRQLLTMALEDLTPREIAEVLGITENNVAVRLTRARAALRELLAGRRPP
ncbi:MAG TPA: sigma-70 family RNA polymerase sigma factor [Kofleriaceae bacterium]|jgi:RNA polymerase sigma-70 factor (ECF subfamily)|nr:sigma-70 family RNA polymerase sigma factor [Kofleriaceae bacterium]